MLLFVPFLAVLAILAIDVWVYQDARRCADAGTPVVLRIGTFVVDTPAAWLIGCLLLWIVFFPLYVASRAG